MNMNINRAICSRWRFSAIFHFSINTQSRFDTTNMIMLLSSP